METLNGVEPVEIASFRRTEPGGLPNHFVSITGEKLE
jgi:hypothetical protein